MRSVLPSATTVTAAGDNHSPVASSITTSASGDSFFKVLTWCVFLQKLVLFPFSLLYCLVLASVFPFLSDFICIDFAVIGVMRTNVPSSTT